MAGFVQLIVAVIPVTFNNWKVYIRIDIGSYISIEIIR